MEAQRHTGVTTRLALELALHALNSAGTWVYAVDHYADVNSDCMLCDLVSDIFHRLGVDHETRNYSIRVIPIQHKEYPK